MSRLPYRCFPEFIRIPLNDILQFFKDLLCDIQPPVVQHGRLVKCIVIEADSQIAVNAPECVLSSDQQVIAVNFHVCAEVAVPRRNVFLAFLGTGVLLVARPHPVDILNAGVRR